jgi:hypothetical protein
MLSTTGSSFRARQIIYPPAISFYALWPSSKQRTRHASEFPTGQRIGLLTHRELTASALKPQKTWGFLQLDCNFMSSESHGMLASTKGSASSTKAKALILTASKWPKRWAIRLSRALAIGILYLHIVRTLSFVYADSSH